MSSFVAVPTTKQDSPLSAIRPSSSKGSMRRSPGGGSLGGSSSEPLTDVPYGAVAIERPSTLPRGRDACRGLLGGAAALLHVQHDAQDPARGRGGGLGAEPALLERGDDHVARVRVGRERRVPRLVG